jgi:hypothetical protein
MGELEKYVKAKDVSLVYLSNNKEIPVSKKVLVCVSE